jgi:hypothetical protein
MSLINDALKRASQSDRARSSQPAGVGRMRPAEEPSNAPLTVFLIVGIVVACGSAGWLFWQWSRGISPTEPPPVMIAPPSATALAVAKVQPPPTPAPAPRVATAPAAAVPATPTPSPALNPATVTKVVPVPAKPVEAWPELKLSAIIFSKNNPMAIINGKMLGAGETIDGAHVTKIEPEQVSVEWKGKVKVLVMN